MTTPIGSKIILGLGPESAPGVPAISGLEYLRPSLPVSFGLQRTEGESSRTNPGGYPEAGVPGPINHPIEVATPLTMSYLLRILEHLCGGIGTIVKATPESGVFTYTATPNLNATETTLFGVLAESPLDRMFGHGGKLDSIELAIEDNQEIQLRAKGMMTHGTRMGVAVESVGNSGTYEGPRIRGTIADRDAGDVWIKIAAAAVQATGTIVFADKPTADTDTITLNGIVCEFSSSPSDATAAGTAADPILIEVKADLELTLDETIATLNDANMPAAAALATYTEDGVDTLTITVDLAGPSGNAFTLAASSDTVSAATCTGGLTPTFYGEQSSGTPASYDGSAQSILQDADGDAIWQNVQGGAADSDLGIWAENKDPIEVIFYGDDTALADIAVDDEWKFPITWSDPTPTYLTGQRMTSAHLIVERRDVGGSTWSPARILKGTIGLNYALTPDRGNASRYAYALDRTGLWMGTVQLVRRFNDLVWQLLQERHQRSELRLSFQGQQIGTSGAYREGLVATYASVGISSLGLPISGPSALEETIDLKAETNDAGDAPVVFVVTTGYDWTVSS